MRMAIQLGFLIAAAFAVALMLLVRRGPPESDAPTQAAAVLSMREERPVEHSVAATAAPGATPIAAEEGAQLLEPFVEPPPPEAGASAPREPLAATRVFTSAEISGLVAADPELGRTIEAMLGDPDPEVRRGAAELYNAFLEASSPATPPSGEKEE